MVGLFHVEFGFRSFLLGFCASFFVCAVATGKMPFLFRAFNFFVWLCWVCAIICIFCLAFAVFLFLFQLRQGQFFGGLVGILFQCSTFAYLIKKCWARALNFLISRRASAVFFAGVGLSRQPVF